VAGYIVFINFFCIFQFLAMVLPGICKRGCMWLRTIHAFNYAHVQFFHQYNWWFSLASCWPSQPFFPNFMRRKTKMSGLFLNRIKPHKDTDNYTFGLFNLWRNYSILFRLKKRLGPDSGIVSTHNYYRVLLYDVLWHWSKCVHDQ